MSVKEKIKEEKLKISGLEGKEKAAYIWDYYKVPIISVVAGAVILIYVVTSVIHNRNINDIFSCAFVNQVQEIGITDELADEFMAYCQADEKEDRVQIDDSYEIVNGTPKDYNEGQNSYIWEQKLMILMNEGDLDVILTDEAFAKRLANEACAADLAQVLPEELYEHLADCIFLETDENGTEFAAGIRMETSALAQREEIKLLNRPVLVALRKAKNPEYAVKFVEFCFGE